MLSHSRRALRGYCRARNVLALRYRRGNEGEEQDYAKAALHFRLSAEQGHMLAQYHLGWMYGHGEGFEKDLVRAAHWYAKAVEERPAGCHPAERGFPDGDVEDYTPHESLARVKARRKYRLD